MRRSRASTLSVVTVALAGEAVILEDGVRRPANGVGELGCLDVVAAVSNSG